MASKQQMIATSLWTRLPGALLLQQSAVNRRTQPLQSKDHIQPKTADPGGHWWKEGGRTCKSDVGLSGMARWLQAVRTLPHDRNSCTKQTVWAMSNVFCFKYFCWTKFSALKLKTLQLFELEWASLECPPQVPRCAAIQYDRGESWKLPPGAQHLSMPNKRGCCNVVRHENG